MAEITREEIPGIGDGLDCDKCGLETTCVPVVFLKAIDTMVVDGVEYFRPVEPDIINTAIHTLCLPCLTEYVAEANGNV